MRKLIRFNAILMIEAKHRLGDLTKLLMLSLLSIIPSCAPKPPTDRVKIFVPSKLISTDRKEGSSVILEQFVLFEQGVPVDTHPKNLEVDIDRAIIEFATLNQKMNCFDVTAIIDQYHTKISFTQKTVTVIDGENVIIGQVVPKLGCSSFRGVTYWFDKSTRTLVRTVYER